MSPLPAQCQQHQVETQGEKLKGDSAKGDSCVFQRV